MSPVIGEVISCPECKGRGWTGPKDRCPICQGDGQVEVGASWGTEPAGTWIGNRIRGTSGKIVVRFGPRVREVSR